MNRNKNTGNNFLFLQVSIGLNSFTSPLSYRCSGVPESPVWAKYGRLAEWFQVELLRDKPCKCQVHRNENNVCQDDDAR